MPDARTESNRPETLRLARSESIVEARPRPEVPGAEEMFLSPRVLDAGAFARYAEMLKSLIGEARQGARHLQDFSADADQMIAGCEKAGEQIRVRLEAGSRVVRMIDERADRAEQILENLRREMPDQARIREMVEPAVRAAMEAAQQRAAEITLETERRARATAGEIEQKLAAMSARAEEQAARLERSGHAIEEKLAAIEARLAAMMERADLGVGEFETRTRQATEAAESRLHPMLARATETAGSIDDALGRAWRHAEERAGQITARLGPLQQACDSVLDRLGLDPSDPDPSGSVLHTLENLVQRSEQSLHQSERVIGQMEHLRGQAEGVKTEFGAWLLDAAARLDELEARREALTGPLSEAAEKIASVTPMLEDDLKLAVTTMDQLQLEQSILREALQSSVMLARHTAGELNNQSAQLKALIDGSVHTLTRRVEEAGVWLGELIVRAERAGGRTEQTAPAKPMASVTAAAVTPVVTPAARPVAPARPVTPPANSYGLPLPPALPIDAVSFDGAPVVFGHDLRESAD